MTLARLAASAAARPSLSVRCQRPVSQPAHAPCAVRMTGLAAGGLLVALAALGLANGSGREAASPVAGAALQRTYASLPLAFEPNRGQAAPRTDFLARGPGYSTGFARSGLRLRVEDGRRTHSLRVQFEGARPQVLQPAQPLPGRVNYLIGQNRSRWRTNIPTFGQLLARNVYPGIDLLYQGDQGHLRYDFLVAPHADPARVALRFPGVRSLRLARSGDLLLGLPTGKTLRQLRPRAFQNVRGQRRAVPSRYVLDGSSVRFGLGRYHPRRPLVIDPTLAYSTRLGGSSSDYGHGIAVDAGGSTYLTGRTYSTDFPTMDPFQSTNANAGYDDVFVAKLDAGGTSAALRPVEPESEVHVMKTGESTLVQIAVAGGTGDARSSCSAHPAARSVVEIVSSASISERRKS